MNYTNVTKNLDIIFNIGKPIVVSISTLRIFRLNEDDYFKACSDNKFCFQGNEIYLDHSYDEYEYYCYFYNLKDCRVMDLEISEEKFKELRDIKRYLKLKLFW